MHILCCLESKGHDRGWRCHWEPSKGMGYTGVLFVVSSPEAMAEADAVIENLLKVWEIHPCSLLSRVQRSWGILACSFLLRVQSAHDNLKFKLQGWCFCEGGESARAGVRLYLHGQDHRDSWQVSGCSVKVYDWMCIGPVRVRTVPFRIPNWDINKQKRIFLSDRKVIKATHSLIMYGTFRGVVLQLHEGLSPVLLHNSQIRCHTLQRHQPANLPVFKSL